MTIKPPLPLVRRSDELPDGLSNPDNGCDLAPKCLECPLAQCRYDGGAYGIEAKLKRNEHIRELRAAGASIKAITTRFGIGPRTVHRVTSGDTPTNPTYRFAEDDAPPELNTAALSVSRWFKAKPY